MSSAALFLTTDVWLNCKCLKAYPSLTEDYFFMKLETYAFSGTSTIN